MNGINGYTVWYRLEVAVHNYSYLIIKINNYNELPTFLMYVILVYTTDIRLVYVCRRMSHFCRTRTSTGFDPVLRHADVCALNVAPRPRCALDVAGLT